MKAVIALVAILVVVGAVYFLNSAGGSTDLASLHANDREVAEAMSDEYPTEVLEWVAQDKARIVGPWNATQTQARMQSLYDAGALKVWAFGSRMTLKLAVELPEDPAKRAQCFEWIGKYHKTPPGEPKPADEGQKSFMVRLPLANV